MADLNEQMRAELLPCPFCGEHLTDAGHPHNGCWLSGMMIAKSDIKHWNRRHAGSAAQAVAWACPMDERHEPLDEPDVSWGADNPWLPEFGPYPLFTAPPDAEGVKAIYEATAALAQLQLADDDEREALLVQVRKISAALSRRPAAAAEVAAEQPAALTDEQIDQFNRDLCDTPFIFRRKIDKSGYEVVQMMNADWREVIRDDQVVRWAGTDKEEGQAAWARLQTRWALAENQIVEQHLRAAGQGKDSERLDFLDSQGVAYGFEDMHEGNRWVMDGPFPNVRAAIDAAMKAGAQGGGNG